MSCASCGEPLADDAQFCGACGAAQLPDPEIGRVLNQRFKLAARIGRGSFGAMYRGVQLGTGRKVAVKLLDRELSHDPQIVERFRREGEVLCQLRSEHTITTYEFDRTGDGALYIAMELLEGKSLASELAADGPLEWQRAFRIVAAICISIHEAHELGIVHRDLRPENIFLESRFGKADVVKVLDFGLAKLRRADAHVTFVGQTIGTVEYMAPEQLLGREVDARSDIYALGILAYRMVTGAHPFAGARGPADLVAAQIERVPAPPSNLRLELPLDVDAVIGRCLAKDPARRYPDARALGDAIAGVLASHDPGRAPDTIREPPPEQTGVGEQLPDTIPERPLEVAPAPPVPRAAPVVAPVPEPSHLRTAAVLAAMLVGGFVVGLVMFKLAC